MYSISICDDDKHFRDKLAALVRSYFAEKRLDYTLQVFSCGEELVRYKGRTDIAFLNVEMKSINGIQAGYALMHRNRDVFIFIVTSHAEYLDEAMDLRVFRFFQKPVDKLRLVQALDVITEKSFELSFVSNHFPVTLRDNDIVCIYSCGRKTYVLSDTGQSYPTILSMKEWVKRTADIPCYSQPHYSYIINLKYVAETDGRTIVLKCHNGTVMKVEASQRRVRRFRNDLVSEMGHRR